MSCHHPARVIPTILDVPSALPHPAGRRPRDGRLCRRRPTTSTPAPARTSPAEPTQAASPTEQPPRNRPAEARRHRSRAGAKIAPTPLPSARRSTAAQHLLSAARLPALGDDLAWTVVDTDAEASEPTGACRRPRSSTSEPSRPSAASTPAGRFRRRGPPDRREVRRRQVGVARRAGAARLARRLRGRLDYRRKDVGPSRRSPPTRPPRATTGSATARAARPTRPAPASSARPLAHDRRDHRPPATTTRRAGALPVAPYAGFAATFA